MIELNKNYSPDTEVPGVSSLSLARGIPNFGADWKVKNDEPNEVILTNLNSPVAYPENYRFGSTVVKDIYKGTGISPSLYSQSREGTNSLCQLTEVWTKTDTADPSYTVALPISGHVVLKIPNDPIITVEDIIGFLGRLISGFYETGSAEGTRLQAILRGCLKPSDC